MWTVGRRGGARAVAVVGTVAVALAGAGASWGRFGGGSSSLPWVGLSLARVERTDLETVVVVGGEIDGAERTEINCEAEALHPDGSHTLPTLVELIDNGSWVNKGEVLCRFDDSGYEELIRRQQIDVEQAAAERRQAELELDAARVALVAYRDGEAVEAAQRLHGAIALLRSDRARSRERLAWSQTMRGLGYLSGDDLANERLALQRLELDLRAAEMAYRNHLRFAAPKQTRELEVRVEQAADALEFGDLQLENSRKLLEHYREQRAKCVVRAPHDGLVIHSAEIFWGDEYRLRVGAAVYQGQPLFYLPDIHRPVVNVSLNETIAARVRVGATAEVRIDTLPDQLYRGRVESIDQIPSIHWQAGWDVQHVMARVRIDDPPEEGFFPGLSAQVRIVTGAYPGALVVPATALEVDENGPSCTVVHADGHLERRAVVLDAADRDHLRVVSGLGEGEVVVLGPSTL